jgi:16S rRNA (guanine527-N7)-methyltransferase
VDSIFKKIWTVERFCAELELDNVVAHQMRAEDWSTPFDYAVSRATAPLLTLWQWTEPHLVRPLRRTESQYWPRGLIALKGGDLGAEMDDLKHAYTDVEAASLSLYELTGRRDLRDKHILTVSHPRSIE